MPKSPIIQSMQVATVQRLTPYTLLLLLKPEDTFSYQSGQYILLGTDAEALKPFSIASAPKKDGLIECHIRKHDDSDWMNAIFALKPGDSVFVDGPHNQYQIPDNLSPEQHLIFVAGGTGYTAMKALLDEIILQALPNPVTFYWGAQTEQDLYRHNQMQTLAQQYPNIQYISVLSKPPEDFEGLTGWVHEQVLHDYTDLTGKRVFLCGPWVMQETAKEVFLEAGLKETDFN